MMGDFIEPPDPRLRRANQRLLIILVVFALALMALIIVWMHHRSEEIYRGNIKPPEPISMLDRRQFHC